MYITADRSFITKVLMLAVLISGLIASAAAFYVGEPTYDLISPYKRSAMDLAMIQVYRICDGDMNGLFSKDELQCVQRVLQILFTGRAQHLKREMHIGQKLARRQGKVKYDCIKKVVLASIIDACHL